MQDRPTAAELLKAAREFCERDLVPNLTGRLRFHARVLQNVLGTLEREWQSEEDAVGAEWERLQRLLGKQTDRPAGFATLREEVRTWNADLCSRIRSGEFDDRSPELLDALYETTVEKLRIANPRYSEGSSAAT